MMMKRAVRNILLVGITIVLFSSCKKDKSPEPNPAFGNAPTITLKSVSPLTIHQFDSLVFTIHYTDGDGDLGDYDADTLSLWITDNRFPLTEKFHIPPLAPQGSTISIEGDLLVTLEHIILENSTSTSESATFTIKLKDRAGNWSNEVTSEAVTILP